LEAWGAHVVASGEGKALANNVARLPRKGRRAA
jgi:hypothetical protein